MTGRPRCHALICGGGTAGHTVPAIAIGQALVELGHPPATIQFVGGRRGSEGRLVAAAGFAIAVLPGRGIRRSLTPGAMAANIGAVLGLGAAVALALAIVARRRPAVVISVGGYAGFGCALAAGLLRRPLLVADSNAVAGAANRFTARFAAASAVAFEGTPLPRATVTGNPVRPEVLAVDRSPEGRAAARAALGVPAGAVLIGVSGGSLGSRRINAAVRGLVDRWADRSGVAVRHAVGRRDWATFAAALPALGADGIRYDPVEYDDRLDVVLAAADIWVGRAGGSTCAELAVCGLPSILVPLPGAPGDHQTANARAMVAAGAAVLVPDADLDDDRLAAELGPLVADAAERDRMAAAAKAVGRPDAAARVAALAESVAR